MKNIVFKKKNFDKFSNEKSWLNVIIVKWRLMLLVKFIF